MNGAVFGLMVAVGTAIQAGLGLLFVWVALPALDRLESPYVAIPKFWLMALFSTTGILGCALVLWALAGEPAQGLAYGAGLFYVAQVPFGIAGTIGFVLRQARRSQIKRAVKEIAGDPEPLDFHRSA